MLIHILITSFVDPLVFAEGYSFYAAFGMFTYLFICGPFSYVASSPEYIASNGEVTSERTIGKYEKKKHNLRVI
jgi:hypothetical protein